MACMMNSISVVQARLASHKGMISLRELQSSASREELSALLRFDPMRVLEGLGTALEDGQRNTSSTAFRSHAGFGGVRNLPIRYPLARAHYKVSIPCGFWRGLGTRASATTPRISKYRFRSHAGFGGVRNARYERVENADDDYTGFDPMRVLEGLGTCASSKRWSRLGAVAFRSHAGFGGVRNLSAGVDLVRPQRVSIPCGFSRG